MLSLLTLANSDGSNVNLVLSIFAKKIDQLFFVSCFLYAKKKSLTWTHVMLPWGLESSLTLVY
jgi:hypothetical protein